MASRLLSTRAYSAAAPHRSGSDDGLYVAAVNDALRSDRRFRRFKRDPRYSAILEHVTRSQGRDYLAAIRRQAPDLLEPATLARFKANDELGTPRTFDYGAGVGTLSPTTLRYVKVLADLRRHFDMDKVVRIAEIGCGYGGQTLVTDQWTTDPPRSFELYDLPCVLALTAKYLEAHALNGSYACRTINQTAGEGNYDLVISNYAFSELPRHLQLIYVRKVLSRATRGYLTMNSGAPDAPPSRSLRLNELLDLIPGAFVVEEWPLTAPHNYILVWDAIAPRSPAGQ